MAEEVMNADLLAKVPPMGEMTDRFGNKIYFGHCGDFWSPPFPLGADNDFWTHTQQIKNMEIRDDDIILTGYPKTGNHWHSEIIGMLMLGDASYCGMHEKASSLSLAFVDQMPISVVDSLPSPRLIFLHTPFRHFPRQALEKKVKIIYLERNPKDVFVSYYNHMRSSLAPIHYPGQFDHFFHLMLECGFYYGDLFHYLMEHQEGFEAHPEVPVYTSAFEDIKMDPVGTVVKLNEFLGTGCSKEVCEEIAEACSFKKMKSHKDKNASEGSKQIFKSGKLGFYRKGEIGDWKNWFTVAMNEKFDAEYKKRMAGYKRTYKFS